MTGWHRYGACTVEPFYRVTSRSNVAVCNGDKVASYYVRTPLVLSWKVARYGERRRIVSFDLRRNRTSTGLFIVHYLFL
jgi:hypothetical protein